MFVTRCTCTKVPLLDKRSRSVASVVYRWNTSLVKRTNSKGYQLPERLATSTIVGPMLGCPHIDNNKNYVIVSCLFQVVLCRFQHIPSLILFRSCAQNRGFLRRPSSIASPPCLPSRVSCGRSGFPLALRPARPCSGCRAPPGTRVSRMGPRRQEIRSEPPPALSQHSLPCLRGTLHKPQPSALRASCLLLHA